MKVARVLACALHAAFAVSLLAQSPATPPSPVSPPPVTQPATTAAPGAEHLFRAFKYVREQLERAAEREAGHGDAPDSGLLDLADEGAPDIGAAGVCVTLRLNGAEIARGTAAGGVQDLKAATAAAIKDAVLHLPAPRDALQRDARADAWRRITASLELAGPLVQVHDLATFAEAESRVLMGLEGVAVRMGDRTDLVFPAQMLVANDSPATALVSLVSRVSGDPTLAMPGVEGHDAAALAKSRGVTYYKFRTSHAAQLAPGGAAVPLTRGGRVVASREVTTASLRAFAAHMSDNLLAQRTQVDGREELFASYWPLQGRDGPLATPREKAFACLAICEATRLTATPDPTNPLPRTIESVQELLIPMLSIGGRLNDADLSASTSASLIVCMSELFTWTGKPRGDWFEPMRARLAKSVLAATNDDGAWNEVSRPGERGIIALAMVQLAVDPVLGAGNQSGPDAIAARTRATAAVRALFRETAPAGLITHMPWLGRAEVLLAGNGGQVTAAAALRQMREQAWSNQLSPDAAAAIGGDMEGGLVMGGASVGGMPTVHSTRALSFFAQMLGDARLTDDPERIAQTSRMLKGLRFLRQLAIDDNWDWCTPDPVRAHWGIRAGVFDQRQSLEGTAMTLITVTSTVRSVDAMKK